LLGCSISQNSHIDLETSYDELPNSLAEEGLGKFFGLKVYISKDFKKIIVDSIIHEEDESLNKLFADLEGKKIACVSQTSDLKESETHSVLWNKMLRDSEHYLSQEKMLLAGITDKVALFLSDILASQVDKNFTEKFPSKFFNFNLIIENKRQAHLTGGFTEEGLNFVVRLANYLISEKFPKNHPKRVVIEKRHIVNMVELIKVLLNQEHSKYLQYKSVVLSNWMDILPPAHLLEMEKEIDDSKSKVDEYKPLVIEVMFLSLSSPYEIEYLMNKYETH